MIVTMNRFGRTLTDRQDGKNAYEAIVRSGSPPYDLDFSGVVSMGSSFGDEVVIKLARSQGNRIKVMNANDGVRASLRRAAEGTQVVVELSAL